MRVVLTKRGIDNAAFVHEKLIYGFFINFQNLPRCITMSDKDVLLDRYPSLF